MFAQVKDAELARSKLLDWKQNADTHLFLAEFIDAEGKLFYVSCPCREGVGHETLWQESANKNALNRYFVSIPEGLADLDVKEFVIRIGDLEVFSINDSALMLLATAIANGHKP